MEQPIYEYVKQQLEAAKYRWPTVAAGAGVSLSTLKKIARDEIKDPGVSHVQKLHDYFKSQGQPA